MDKEKLSLLLYSSFGRLRYLSAIYLYKVWIGSSRKGVLLT